MDLTRKGVWMAEKVIYKQGTKATYLGLSEHISSALYFCTDTRELFKGDDLYSDGLRLVGSCDVLPSFTVAADGILYFCEDNGCGYVLNATRNGWLPVIHGVDDETIAVNESGALVVKAVPASNVSGLDEHITAIVEQEGGEVADLVERVTAVEGEIDSLQTDIAAVPAQIDSKVDARVGTLKIGETAYDDVTAYVDAKTAGIATDAQLGNLNSEVNALKAKVDTEGKVSEAITSAVSDGVAGVEAKIGTVPADKTVVEMISDAQVAATYDDTEIKANITSNKEAIDVLNGSGTGSVQKTVDDAINKFATDVTDDGVVNSYKELIDWVAEHGGEAAEMAAAIDALEAIDHEAYKSYADQAEADALTAAKEYADSLAENYDAAGAADQALTDAKAYTDAAVTDSLVWGSF